MSHQAQILEKRGISQLYILCRHEYYETLKFVSLLKTNFLNSSPNEVFLNLQTFHMHCYILVNQVIYVSYFYKQFSF